jgi:biotin carboxyl carrier protein
MSYVPGLIVERSAVVRKDRELPIPGESLVRVGDVVRSDQPVLSAEIPGEIAILRIADRLGISPERACAGLKVAESQSVAEGDLIAEIRYLFGLMRDEVRAPCDGVIEYLLASTAHVGLRQPSRVVEISAYIPGRVVEVDDGKRVRIETAGAFVQGIFGVGGERSGELLILESLPDRVIKAGDLPDKLKGKILVGGAGFTLEAVEAAGRAGASGIVTASLSSLTLTQILGKPLGVSMTGDEDLPSTIIITEGFGQLQFSERTLSILREHQGKSASINGATQVRAGAMRPEIIIPSETKAEEKRASTTLAVGQMVRCIRAPYFGRFGRVVTLPTEPTKIESGAVVRVAGIELLDGERIVVPRANLELA